MKERLNLLLAESAGFTLLDLLDGIGIDTDQRFELVRRIWTDLDMVGKVEVGERLVAGDVANDDQVVTIVAFLLQELVASIGHLRPVSVRLRHISELEQLSDSGPQQVVCSSRVNVGA